MSLVAMNSPALVLNLLLPGWVFAGIVLFIGGVPGEWARMALTVWTALVATMLAGGVAADRSPLALAVLLAGFVAVMTGGPSGLVLAAIAAAALLVFPGVKPNWLALMLALPSALSALGQLVWR